MEKWQRAGVSRWPWRQFLVTVEMLFGCPRRPLETALYLKEALIVVVMLSAA